MAYACREESKTIHLCEDTFVQCFSRWCLPMTYAENINQFLALHLAHCNGRYCNADHGYTFEAWFWWLFSIVFTPDLLSWLTGVRGQHCRVQCWKKLDLHLGIRRDDKANIWKGETADKGREFPYRHREYLQIPCGKHFLFIEQTYQKIPYKCSWPPDVMHDSFIGLMRKRLGGRPVPIEKTCRNEDFVASLQNRVQHNGQNILLTTPMADIIGDMVYGWWSLIIIDCHYETDLIPALNFACNPGMITWFLFV